ncbi:MAG: hypothetical protein LBP62_05935 [Clostridiales bacterium]|jgi:hypothetical protein|nr:hypothetical protein [Clostridiales bacterium]
MTEYENERENKYEKSAEYYFEYKINRVFGDDEIAPPKIYFERDYRVLGLPYTVFAVPKEWLEKLDVFNDITREKTAPQAGQNQNSDGTNDESHYGTGVFRSVGTRDSNKTNAAKNDPTNGLAYDEVKVAFDINGIDCASLTDQKSGVYKNAEIKKTLSFERFYADGCRIIIENNNSREHSGVGVIEMLKKGAVKAKFFFAINFAFRKKIAYSIERKGNILSLQFACKDRPAGIEVKAVYNYRLPCVKDDMNVNVLGESIKLDFSKGARCKRSIKLNGERQKNDKNVFSVGFSNPDLARFYLLDCEKNTSLEKPEKFDDVSANSACPFCHKKIADSIATNKRYKKGGISCSSENNSTASLPAIYDKHGNALKKCLYCFNDLRNENSQDENSKNAREKLFKSGFQRLLPQGYMEHENFKIAFTGSKGAGKTTYISRFFDLTDIKDGSVSDMAMTMTGNSLKKFGINVKPAPLLEITMGEEGNHYKITDANWSARQTEYTERAINLNPPKYPKPTTTGGDYSSYPFIAEINKKAYVSFYDIAGEDAQNTTQVSNIANGELIGVFCLINGKGDINSNNAVVSRLKDAGLDKRCPVAVIVTKMDTLESNFDSNSHCIRSDYFDGTKGYDGSYLEREIDFSSEEIKSYLIQKALAPDFDKIFANVKYFGVSSFNFNDSIHEETERNTAGRVKFECSAKRIELPFVWMLRQFGIIE